MISQKAYEALQLGDIVIFEGTPRKVVVVDTKPGDSQRVAIECSSYDHWIPRGHVNWRFLQGASEGTQGKWVYASDIDRVAATPAPPIFRSTDSATRKRFPVAEGCGAYFPDALLCVAFVSMVGNDKHNPGEPLHWAKEKSTDEKDCEWRHMLDALRGLPPDPGLEELGDLGHLASKAWRALADLQRACDAKVAEWEASK